MSAKRVFSVGSSWLGGKKLLTLTPETLAFGDTDDGSTGLCFSKEDIEGYRYSAWRVRYYVYLYSYYNIDVKGKEQVIKLRMFSLFGIGRKRAAEKYGTMLRLLYDYYFRDMTKYYLQLFHDGIDFEIAGLIFTSAGLIYTKKDPVLAWEDVGTKNYASYYAVYAKNNAGYYKTFDYKDDWNTAIIYAVSRTILRDKGLWSE